MGETSRALQEMRETGIADRLGGHDWSTWVASLNAELQAAYHAGYSESHEITDCEPFRTLTDPTASRWLKDALRAALDRDPVDAANDAEYLATILAERCAALQGDSDAA